MFNPAKGFIWLVETDEGWERVQVCDTWPSYNNATSVRWRSKLYQKLYDYTSRVDLALGAFSGASRLATAPGSPTSRPATSN